MPQEKTVESIISGFTASILREHFGKGPSSVYVTIYKSFVCIQVRDFLAPMERILLDQNEKNRVLKTRDLLMIELMAEFKRNFWKQADLDVTELYADWNLDDHSGMILGVLEEPKSHKLRWPEEVDETALRKEVIRLSIAGQKEPEETNFFWLNDRTLLIERIGIFTLLEKELIKNEFQEALKLAKRPLEYMLFAESEVPAIVNRPLIGSYVDWDFEEDKGYALLAFKK